MAAGERTPAASAAIPGPTGWWDCSRAGVATTRSSPTLNVCRSVVQPGHELGVARLCYGTRIPDRVSSGCSMVVVSTQARMSGILSAHRQLSRRPVEAGVRMMAGGRRRTSRWSGRSPGSLRWGAGTSGLVQPGQEYLLHDEQDGGRNRNGHQCADDSVDHSTEQHRHNGDNRGHVHHPADDLGE